MRGGPPITAWPLPRDARRVVLVGGTFDPPHRGHVHLVEAWRDSHQRDAALLFVPAAQSPLKEGKAQTPAEHRVAMLRLAVAKVGWSAVWTDEVDRYQRSSGAPSFTIDTLRRLHETAGGVEVRLFIGSDQAARFHEWREAREILKLARPVVMPRAPLETWSSLERALRAANFWTDPEVRAWELDFQGHFTERDPANSTEIRRRVAAGGVRNVPAGWLDPDVAAYIEEHRLYRGV